MDRNKEPIKDQELFVSGKKYLIALETFDYFGIIKIVKELKFALFHINFDNQYLGGHKKTKKLLPPIVFCL